MKRMFDLPRNVAEEVLPMTSRRGLRSPCNKGKAVSKNRSFTTVGQAKAGTKKNKELKTKSDIPKDLAEEVLSRLPVRGFRSPCKKGKALSKNRSFTICKAKAATKKNKLTATIADLPRDLAEEVLSRLPMTSLRGFRSTCKKWNSLSKTRSFTMKHISEAKAAAVEKSIVVMVIDFKVYLMSFNLHSNVDPSVNRQGKLISLDDENQVDIGRVYHCDGLLLCITKDFKRFVVWNPYWGQTLWLKPTSPHDRLDWYRFAIGYQNSNSCRSYKILRFVDARAVEFVEYEIYELNSSSWRVLDVTSDWEIEFYARGVSLKGNTYWFAQDKYPGAVPGEIADFLICFDFTRERFGPRLRLPFHSYVEDTVTLSSVRDEQLAVLFQRWDTLEMEIWVTTKIEPEVVSWNKLFLAVDLDPLMEFPFGPTDGSFFIDEAKRVVVVFDKDNGTLPTRNIAYIIGEGEYFKQVDLGETREKHECPLVCSYVPSLAQIKLPG